MQVTADLIIQIAHDVEQTSLAYVARKMAYVQAVLATAPPDFPPSVLLCLASDFFWAKQCQGEPEPTPEEGSEHGPWLVEIYGRMYPR